MLEEIKKLNKEYKGKFFNNECGNKIEITNFYLQENEAYCSYKNYRISDIMVYGAIWKYFGKRLSLISIL